MIEYLFVIIVLIISGSILWIFYTKKERKESTIKRRNEKRGESKNGEYNENNGAGLVNPMVCNSETANWVDGKCVCKIPYFGETCSEESFSDKYYNVGEVVNTLPVINTDSLSFGKSSCTKLCDTDSSCLGVIYENNKCSLINSPFLNVRYNPERLGNVYMKKKDSKGNNIVPQFNDRAFLIRGKPERLFWTNAFAVYPGKIYALDFVPTVGIPIPGYSFLFSDSASFENGIERKTDVGGLGIEGTIYVKIVTN